MRQCLEAFFANLNPDLRLALRIDPQVHQFLEQVLDTCEEAFPKFRLEPKLFLAHLAKCCPPENSKTALHRIQVQDVYVACACLQGKPQAIEYVQKKYNSLIQSVFKRMNVANSLNPDDIQQLLWERLFVPVGGRFPKIGLYTGRGPLSAWMSITLARLILNELRKRPMVYLDETDILENLATPEDTTLEYFKKQYRREFKIAFRGALKTLSAQERNVLRRRLLDGLEFKEIGKLHCVHTSSVYRWMIDIRTKLHQGIQNELQKQLDLEPSECLSIIRMIQSRLEISLASHSNHHAPGT